MTELEKQIKAAILSTLVVVNKESIEKYALPAIMKAINQSPEKK